MFIVAPFNRRLRGNDKEVHAAVNDETGLPQKKSAVSRPSRRHARRAGLNRRQRHKQLVMLLFNTPYLIMAQ